MSKKSSHAADDHYPPTPLERVRGSEAEFYIGWMQKAPAGFTRFIKKYLLVMLLLVMALGVLLAMNQKQFSKANFEFGKPTVVTGIYQSSPVPHLLVADHNSYIMVPLVGYGKHGAEGVMKELALEKKKSLDGKQISLKGTLLYGDGKILMQVDKNEDPLMNISETTNKLSFVETSRGEVYLQGEIIDPKCYFGVMKPGEGKVHKDCAIRCILGGIPPVLKITNKAGQTKYVLMTGNNINERVKDWVAAPSQISGTLKKYTDWEILEVKKIQNIEKNPLCTVASDTCTEDCCKK